MKKLLAGVLAAVALVVAGVASADSTRVTQGDANAVLQSFGNGGWTILLHAKVVQGAPADGLAGGLATIRPFDNFNGKHYCALDWHALVLADIEGGDATYTQADAAAIIAQETVTLAIDGTPVSLTQTSVKPFSNPSAFGLVNAYYSQWGAVLAPNDLAVGSHTVSGTSTFAGKTVFRNKISITIDAPGTGTCT
jgi:hypothetical protein